MRRLTPDDRRTAVLLALLVAAFGVYAVPLLQFLLTPSCVGGYRTDAGWNDAVVFAGALAGIVLAPLTFAAARGEPSGFRTAARTAAIAIVLTALVIGWLALKHDFACYYD